MTEEHKRKIALANKGNVPWNKGKTGYFSIEMRKRIGSFQIGNTHTLGLKWKRPPITLAHRKKLSIASKGERNFNWRGGVTPENELIRNSIEYRLWREAVFARDHWNCQNCGKHGNIQAHHIKSFSYFPELRFAIDNGITLCIDCHSKLHPKIKNLISNSANYKQEE